MLRLLGRVAAFPPGPGQLAPDPAAVSERMSHALALGRHCADACRRYREQDTAAASALADAWAAAAIRAATITRHLGVALDLSVKIALTGRGAPRSPAEVLRQRRHKAATAALAEAEKEADRGHQEILGHAARITTGGEETPTATTTANAAAGALRGRR